MPEETKRKWDMLREEFRAKADAGEWRGDWWAALPIEAKRTLCVLAGVDDSPEFAKRRWGMLSLGNQLLISQSAREWARMMAPMRWA